MIMLHCETLENDTGKMTLVLHTEFLYTELHAEFYSTQNICK